MSVACNSLVTIVRAVGDLDPIPFQLLDNLGVAIDITGKTLQMRLVNVHSGAAKLTAGSCTISTAATGKGYYQPVAADVDTKGTFAVYVIDVIAGPTTADPRYPYDGPKYLLTIVGEDGSE